MSRISALGRERLTPELAKYAELAAVGGPEQALMFQVLGHCPEMVESYLRFYFRWHTGGAVDPVLKELVRLKVAQLNDCFT
jgi:hypothetical protein